MSTRIIFFGTPEFAVPFLDRLAANPDFEIAAVVTQPDKPAGRSKTLAPPPIKTPAEKLGLEVLQPRSLKTAEAAELLKKYNAGAFVVVAYGKIIPRAVLDIPKFGAINVHPSLLPKYRGPAPMQEAIASGDSKTGISIMLLDEGMDTGPILAAKTIELDDEETLPSLMQKVHDIGPNFLVETLKKYLAGELKPKPQDDTKATITKLLSREDGRIDWNRPAEEIYRRFRAYTPWPGLWTVWNRGGKETRVKILEMKPSYRQGQAPGSISLDQNSLLVGTQDQSIEILKFQPDGKNPMTAKEFQNGYPDAQKTSKFI